MATRYSYTQKKEQLIFNLAFFMVLQLLIVSISLRIYLLSGLTGVAKPARCRRTKNTLLGV
ncbi:MAG: hypothetical protein ABIQ00_07395 [Chitinophagaceae bacterium]